MEVQNRSWEQGVGSGLDDRGMDVGVWIRSWESGCRVCGLDHGNRVCRSGLDHRGRVWGSGLGHGSRVWESGLDHGVRVWGSGLDYWGRV